jgi:hypothetical protein
VSLLSNYDPDLPTARPTGDQVSQWLKQATGDIDVMLATRGYTVPLKAKSNYVLPAGMTGINGLHPNVYLKLQSVAAAYAAHFVEAARHGSAYLNADDNAKHWMEIYDDFCSRLESAADNLSPFGVDGPFVPEVDEAKGISSGNLGFRTNSGPQTDPTQEGPLFTTNMAF